MSRVGGCFLTLAVVCMLIVLSKARRFFFFLFYFRDLLLLYLIDMIWPWLIFNLFHLFMFI